MNANAILGEKTNVFKSLVDVFRITDIAFGNYFRFLSQSNYTNGLSQISSTLSSHFPARKKAS